MNDRREQMQPQPQPRSQLAGVAPQFHPWRLSAGMLATALAWFALMGAGEVLTANVCGLSDANGPKGPPSWAMPVLIAISVACFALAIVGVVIAWRNVVLTREKRKYPLEGRARRVAELEWFLARISALSSAMFMFGMFVTVLAVAIVSPCGGPW
ncbi:hypothetical protein KZJ38_12755 [Paraburkholderia edwinii]|uniref:Uncharacterized protein n=1 Tax=Paraburkholderia edwinii TaxID=2861782 RepID=A0ABX8UEQ3_9BURK|nr:hypothetical protein [Paraburkholderia edwinii]QYD67251.1 hypothetical protein KZJ38_12755 [Paraburkholderia edwinii]